jgi:coenzyme F420 hydrogenase subunit beta
MGQIGKDNAFGNISSKDLIEATYKAVENFQVRAFFEAKDEILKCGRLNENEFYEILYGMIDAETERKLILKKLKGKKPLFLEEIAMFIPEFTPEKVFRDVIYLKEQGFVEEIIEEQTKKIKKTVKGVVKEVEEKKLFYRYQVKKIANNFKEHYFEPVSIIFENEICCACGWCSSICPLAAIKITADYLEIDDKICISCGLCFSVCPRSFSIDQGYNAIKQLDKSLIYNERIGFYKNLYSGTTTKEEIKSIRQNGGIVTSLLEYLLENKLVDAIVAVQHSQDLWRPEPVIVENVKDLYKTGGTKYANSPSLSIIDKTRRYNNIAIVGVPCMMKALEKGSLFPNGLPFFRNIKYKIGLFCMESFSYDNIVKLVKEQFKKDIHDLTKMNIEKGNFIITLTTGEEMSLPMKEIQSYARHNCHFCDDLTSDYADISVGSIGSPTGWSSIIIRSNQGEKIFNGAVENGLIESKSMKEVEAGQSTIEKLSGTKKSKCKPFDLSSNKEKKGED